MVAAMNTAIRAIWFFFGFMLGWIAFAVMAYGAEVGRVGADGGYHYHDSAWEGIWIPTRCCGKTDCHKANQGDGFQVDRLEDGSGYILRIPASGEDAGKAFFVAYNDPIVAPAEDGEYWICTRWDGASTSRVPRCLFTPPLGF
jgi:hypothetical protein